MILINVIKNFLPNPEPFTKKGIFNPAKADAAFNALDKNGFFTSGHRVKLDGDNDSIDQGELNKRISAINAEINSNENLKKIKDNLAKNAQTQALTSLFESLDPSRTEELLGSLSHSNQSKLKIDILASSIQGMPEAVSYIKLCNETKEEIQAIENEAKESAPRWAHAVSLFNDRFVDMPFTLSIPNQAQAVLGKEKARLLFTFKDGNDIVEWNRSEIKTLSQGEKRALYLLNFIFDVESRLNTGNDILFIIDDVADSFDYKNKHAIIQYLEDIDSTPHFYQIILTHNFDFFRALANNFTNRRRCLMANRNALGISLTRADGIKNYFTGIMKQKFQKSRSVLCATIPFTRNIIEYTKGESDPDYLTLTNLLHWKENTDQITVDDYVSIFNSTFGTSYSGEKKPLKELLYEEADNISNQASHDGLNLEDKVLLSMATRMKSEEFIIREIRRITNNNDYWCNSNNQFGFLIKKYTELVNESQALRSLEKVSITVSSNIHLNSFMYEPILDLTIDHLIYLYNEIKNLKHD